MEPNLPLFVISDTHWFDQESIDVYGRPEDYNDRLVDNWNSVVGDDDIVIHLGDLVISDFSHFEELSKRLKGRKFLVKGNRDNQPDQWYENLGFTLLHPFELRYGNYRVSFSHRPHLQMHKHEICVHGHIHSAGVVGINERHINVCVEVRDYTPQPIEKLLTAVTKRLGDVGQ